MKSSLQLRFLGSTIATAFHAVSRLGMGWLFFRLRYALRRKTGGLVRRAPPARWDEIQPQKHIEWDNFRSPQEKIGAICVADAEAVLRGQFRLFSFHVISAGFAPAWNRNQLTGELVPDDRHWSSLKDFAFGDIKGVWELSRFSWAFALARAYGRTSDARFAEGFWCLFEDWLDKNPPNLGPNWMCGQEASFRLMAVCFARSVFAGATATTPLRLNRYHRFLVATGRRIFANLDYALSQSNNHGVSECVGLVTAAACCAGHPEATSWRTRGLCALRTQLADLVYTDGGFSQHSAVYHRVLLHDIIWLVTVLRRTRAAVPDWILAAGRRALGFIAGLMDEKTGWVPLYGANDGANILPLADADHLDFRPVVQAGAAVLQGVLPLQAGPWDEAAVWLAPAVCPRVDNPPLSIRAAGSIGCRHFSEAGVMLWAVGESRLFFRCPTRFRHRPAQADLLHVGVTWRGQLIAHDPGTFSYNTTGSFAGGLKEAAVHNTLTFDGSEPLRKVGRFLYLPWPEGTAGLDATSDSFGGTHTGWRTLGLSHERRIRARPAAKDEGWEVTDRVAGTGHHRCRLQWLLADFPYALHGERASLVLHTPEGDYELRWHCSTAIVSLVRGAEQSNRGWWSPYYGHAAPALSLVVEFDFDGAAEVTTILSPVE